MYLVYCNWHSLLHLPTMLVMMLANVFKLDVAFSGFEYILMLCTCGNGLQSSLSDLSFFDLFNEKVKISTNKYFQLFLM